MYQTETDILNILAGSEYGVQFSSLSDVEAEALDRLLDLEYVSRSVCLPGNTASNLPVVYRISPAGREALSSSRQEQEEKRQRRSDQEAQEERQRLQAEALAVKNRRNVLFSAIVGAIVGAVVTGLIAYFLH